MPLTAAMSWPAMRTAAAGGAHQRINVVTLAVSQSRSRLNLSASKNMESKAVAFAVSQLVMSALKLRTSFKNMRMLVMALTSHSEMWPSVCAVAAGSAIHSITALFRLFLSEKLAAGAHGGEGGEGGGEGGGGIGA